MDAEGIALQGEAVMPKGSWNKKDERQYKAVLKSCLARDGRKTKKCKSMAAAVVNKRRGVEGRVKHPKKGPFTSPLRKDTKIEFRFCDSRKKCRWISAKIDQKKPPRRGTCVAVKITDKRIPMHMKKGGSLICGLPIRRSTRS